MRGRVVLAGLALGIAPLAGAAAQQDFPQTLYWGSGLIDIPVAWVSPLSGDAQATGMSISPEPQ